eukprot:scaffold25834_cov21-Tisochrysis_lutea.AAC.1
MAPQRGQGGTGRPALARKSAVSQTKRSTDTSCLKLSLSKKEIGLHSSGWREAEECAISPTLCYQSSSVSWHCNHCCALAGNGGSHDKCRRRWDLCDSPILRYKDFNAFDRAMTHLEKAFGFVSAQHQYISR